MTFLKKKKGTNRSSFFFFTEYILSILEHRAQVKTLCDRY